MFFKRKFYFQLGIFLLFKFGKNFLSIVVLGMGCDILRFQISFLFRYLM